MADRLTVFACWQKARQEHPGDPERRKGRYVELMREHGHIVPGKQEPLPCGWPNLPSIDDLFTPEQRTELNDDLREMARLRRKAEAEAANWPMP